ncbi:MAG TPA: heterodisulfide reductase-related iron-sulfur binding cluster [Syntrophorhabdaceae bacterium]|jgi:heterodisulfide reductase subunit B|nr:hypothetical protein [Syntrophorhabdaceae bacterium]OQC49527.1 MAG: hypothetical protein BWX58_00702 [Deltaproteobacteria bacterium ADurb.Bin026]HOS06257.1 heterodisulfide reductase-related iron-sulfur binding cluster [Syntrophorhabdaceae bacterium]HPL41689.1 heterodisulfide reductase-related iron-sulfur binding cluster [Syntrophorhabdaceae bacterium]HPN98013.1 heterodisulfide reductase-related iron-sulfur binding cluster [Syntrophorhabdaceae bacterium]
MEYGYYPGCSLIGSAHRLNSTTKKIFKRFGHDLKEIPDWHCCGAFEYGNKNELTDFSKSNLKKAHGFCNDIVAPCPACYKNLKEANQDDGGSFSILHPLDVFEYFDIVESIDIKHDLEGRLFTPYYGCVLLRPKETAIKNKDIMENFITRFGGDVDGEKVKDRCCGGNQFFINRWATEKLSRLIIDNTHGDLVVFCPLCHMALKTFSENRKVIYFNDLLLYVMGETDKL